MPLLDIKTATITEKGQIAIPKDIQFGNIKINSSIFLLTCIPLYN
mgnify:CR=1 FL=1